MGCSGWSNQVAKLLLKQHAACVASRQLPGELQQHLTPPAGSFLKAAECAAELQQAAQADEWGQTGAVQQAQAERSQALHQASP